MKLRTHKQRTATEERIGTASRKTTGAWKGGGGRGWEEREWVGLKTSFARPLAANTFITVDPFLEGAWYVEQQEVIISSKIRLFKYIEIRQKIFR